MIKTLILPCSSCCIDAVSVVWSFLANRKSIISQAYNFQSHFMLSSVTTVPFLTAADGARYDAKVTGTEVSLIMEAQHSETKCNLQSFSLENLLSKIGLDMRDIPSTRDDDISWPTFLNSSVARQKTLIPIVSTERLHAVSPPQNPTKLWLYRIDWNLFVFDLYKKWDWRS